MNQQNKRSRLYKDLNYLSREEYLVQLEKMVSTPKNKLRVKLKKLGKLYSGKVLKLNFGLIVKLVKKSPATPKLKNIKTIGKFKVILPSL